MKKILSLGTIVCMILLSCCFSVSAAAMVSSFPADGAVGVDIHTDLTLTFDDFIDPAAFNRDKITINGSHDMVEEFVYDELGDPFSITLDLKPLEYGTRYVVKVEDVLINDSPVSAVIAFTTQMPSGGNTVVDFIDGSKERIFSYFSSLFNASPGCSYDETEQATVVRGGNQSALIRALVGWNEADALIVKAKPADGATGFSIRTTRNGGNWTTQDVWDSEFWSNEGINFTSADEYVDYTIPISHTEEEPDSPYLWTQPIGSGSIYVKSITLVTVKEVPFTNQPVMVTDATKDSKFFKWSSWMGSSSVQDGANYLAKADEWWRLKDPVNSYPKISKVVITAKADTASARLGLIFSNTTDAWTGATTYYFQETKDFPVIGEYVDMVFDIPHKDTDPAQVSCWMNNAKISGVYIKSIRFLPENYTEGDYVWGSYDVIKNYGADDEKVVTNAGLEAGDYSAVLSGLHNMSGSKVEVRLISALYENGKLINADIETAALENGESLETPLIATCENVPDYAEGYAFKAFLLDGNMAPMKEAISIENDKRVRVLIAGNSITYHEPADIIYNGETIKWTGAWGMAASAEKNDYAHRLISAADAAGYKTEFLVGNVKSLENDPSIDITSFSEYKDFNPDIFVVALGANVREENVSAFVPAYQKLIDYIGAEKVIVVSTICGGSAWNEIKAMAEENQYAYVDCLATYNANSGDPNYTWNYMAQRTFGNNSVGWHPGNGGMKIMADQIWEEELNAAIAQAAAEK